jgi:alpha-1,3-rhamnosyl/mannosyltransferase
MRVIVNALSAVGMRTGVGHYTAQLLDGLWQQAGADKVGCFPGPVLRRAYAGWSWLLSGRAKAAATAQGDAPAEMVPTRPGLRRRLVGTLRTPGRALRDCAFGAACRLGRYELYHEPNHVPLAGGDLPMVLTVHDLSVLLHPQWHPPDRVAYHERNFHRGLARCAHVIAVSDFTRRELVRHLGVTPQRVTRIYNGIRAGLRPLPPAVVEAERLQMGLPEQYLLCLGTVEPRKNVLTLLRAYCALPAAVRGRYPLLLVGGWGWGAADVAEYLRREARHRGVRHLGYVSEHRLAALYNGARALAYPSLYEGFGLPPVEMLACGGAVLASTAGAVAETAGSAAHLVEPLDAAGWRDALLRVCTDDDWHRQLRRGAAEAARAFTWERCAADTLDVYRTVAGGAAAPERAAA